MRSWSERAKDKNPAYLFRPMNLAQDDALSIKKKKSNRNKKVLELLGEFSKLSGYIIYLKSIYLKINFSYEQ